MYKKSTYAIIENKKGVLILKQTLQQIFGQRLGLLRTAAGMSQESVSKVLHISRSSYSYYESGKSSPSLESLRKLVQLYCPGNPEYLLLLDLSDTIAPKGNDSLDREKEILEYFHTFSAEEKDNILAYCKQLTSKRK